MHIDRIASVGCHIQTDLIAGYYRLMMWHRVDGAASMADTHYTHLTWAEVLDVMLVEFDAQRPGYELLDGCWQPSLFD